MIRVPIRNASCWRALLRFLVVPLLCASALPCTVRAASLFPAWRNLYDTTVNRSQFGRGVAVDHRGDVAVCGFIVNESNVPTFYVAKYDGLHGSLMWEYKFNSPFGGGAYATGVAVDSAGNVVATGYYHTSNNDDYFTVKLSAGDGTPVWSLINNLRARTYNGPNNGGDQALAVTVDGGDNILVTGASEGSASGTDIYTVKYDKNGTFVWEYRYNSSGNRTDIPSAIAVDGSNYVLVAGIAGKGSVDGFYVSKYNRDTGVPVWTQTDYNGGYGATGLAVDNDNDVIICGPAAHGDGTYDIKTFKYNSANGMPAWAQPKVYATNGYKQWCGVGVDSVGNVSVTGTSSIGTNGTRIYTARYTAAGAFAWEAYSPAPGNPTADDIARGIIVDGSSNTIVFGESEPSDSPELGLYVGRYDATGQALAPIRYDNLQTNFGSLPNSNIFPPQIAFHKLGGLAIVGNYWKPKGETNNSYVGFSALKFNRFLAATGDPVTAAGLSDKAKLTSLGTAALADTGAISARVTIVDGKKKFAAILTQGVTGAPVLPALQNGDAPGADGKKFQSFLDPVMSENGAVAFVGKLAGAKSNEALGVWTNAFSFNGPVQAVLRQGQPVPGMNGLTVKSISSISLRGFSQNTNELVALIKVAGQDVNASNDTVLLGLHYTNGGVIGTALLRTSQDISAGAVTGKIKTITILTKAKGSTGEGRWQTYSRVVARLGLDDKRTVVVNVGTDGMYSTPFYTGQNTPAFGTAKWKTFGAPATAGLGIVDAYAALGTLQTDQDLKSNADEGIVYISSATAVKVAREGESASGTQGKYASFGDPVINDKGNVAFLATLQGTGVKPNTKSGIWFGPAANVSLLARQGDPAPDGGAFIDKQKWASFLNVALPNGTGAGPVFLAKISGPGVNARNNLGLWGLDSASYVRELLRKGDVLNGRTVTSVTLLQSLPAVSGAARTFNGKYFVVALVSFKGGGQAIYAIGIP